MISVDVYNMDTIEHIASFDIEFEWQYDNLIAFEKLLEENNIRYCEITTYQQEV